MDFLYTANCKINEYDDVEIVVKDGEQIFHFRVALKDIVLPEFFSNMTRLTQGKSNSFSVDGFSLMTYYKFTRNGSYVDIQLKDSHIRKSYRFKFELFLKAIHGAFKTYLREQRLKGEPEENVDILIRWEEFERALKLFS
ncbi:hypothetical protein [Sporosarcina aquimarina]|uniref:BTB domain-containing protein n=1 Tax=Sporosarcina aquimarina TaxID=114975 RepID=A0ABU4G1L8_9BACL|nr:hypothetical protein [Sporosarcina aquimarina]MDW0110213.1 hypothetical protein [Sporosarcina aquimarina]